MKKSKSSKIIAVLLCGLLIFQQTGLAQVATLELNIAGHLASLANTFSPDKFRPLHLRYLSYDGLNNNFKLLLDKGDTKNPKTQDIESTTKDLLNYFFVGIALPNDTFWVNLRPDSPNDIIDPLLAQTEVGKILLEADLQLKKDTANATNPGTIEGKEYWDKLYRKAGEIYGNQNVTIPTLTRPWIVPDEIIIRESTDSAYVYKATLKVMLEQDYLKGNATYSFKDEREKQLNEYSSQLMREEIIPKLTKEINNAKRYAPLRQVYYSLILAQWFKARNQNKNTQYSGRINRKDLTNLQAKTVYSVNTYFNAYKENFEKGEYNIKEPTYTPYGQVIRSYFSGGIQLTENLALTRQLGQSLGAIGEALLPTVNDPSVRNHNIIEVDGNGVQEVKAAAEKMLEKIRGMEGQRQNKITSPSVGSTIELNPGTPAGVGSRDLVVEFDGGRGQVKAEEKPDFSYEIKGERIDILGSPDKVKDFIRKFAALTKLPETQLASAFNTLGTNNPQLSLTFSITTGSDAEKILGENHVLQVIRISLDDMDSTPEQIMIRVLDNNAVDGTIDGMGSLQDRFAELKKLFEAVQQAIGTSSVEGPSNGVGVEESVPGLAAEKQAEKPQPAQTKQTQSLLQKPQTGISNVITSLPSRFSLPFGHKPATIQYPPVATLRTGHITPQSNLDPQANVDLYRRVEEELNLLEQNVGFLPDDNEMVVKLTKLVNDMADFGTPHLRVLIGVNDSEINAGMFPDGTVVVNQSLINKLDTVEELAAVLAHEVVHFDKNHAKRQMDAWYTEVPSRQQEHPGDSNTRKKKSGNVLGNSGLQRIHEYHADYSLLAKLDMLNINPFVFEQAIRKIGGSLTKVNGAYQIQADMAHGTDIDRALNTLMVTWLVDFPASENGGEGHAIPIGWKNQVGQSKMEQLMTMRFNENWTKMIESTGPELLRTYASEAYFTIYDYENFFHGVIQGGYDRPYYKGHGFEFGTKTTFFERLRRWWYYKTGANGVLEKINYVMNMVGTRINASDIPQEHKDTSFWLAITGGIRLPYSFWISGTIDKMKTFMPGRNAKNLLLKPVFNHSRVPAAKADSVTSIWPLQKDQKPYLAAGLPYGQDANAMSFITSMHSLFVTNRRMTLDVANAYYPDLIGKWKRIIGNNLILIIDQMAQDEAQIIKQMREDANEFVDGDEALDTEKIATARYKNYGWKMFNRYLNERSKPIIDFFKIFLTKNAILVYRLISSYPKYAHSYNYNSLVSVAQNVTEHSGLTTLINYQNPWDSWFGKLIYRSVLNKLVKQFIPEQVDLASSIQNHDQESFQRFVLANPKTFRNDLANLHVHNQKGFTVAEKDWIINQIQQLAYQIGSVFENDEIFTKSQRDKVDEYPAEITGINTLSQEEKRQYWEMHYLTTIVTIVTAGEDVQKVRLPYYEWIFNDAANKQLIHRLSPVLIRQLLIILSQELVLNTDARNLPIEKSFGLPSYYDASISHNEDKIHARKTTIRNQAISLDILTAFRNSILPRISEETSGPVLSKGFSFLTDALGIIDNLSPKLVTGLTDKSLFGEDNVTATLLKPYSERIFGRLSQLTPDLIQKNPQKAIELYTLYSTHTEKSYETITIRSKIRRDIITYAPYDIALTFMKDEAEKQSIDLDGINYFIQTRVKTREEFHKARSAVAESLDSIISQQSNTAGIIASLDVLSTSWVDGNENLNFVEASLDTKNTDEKFRTYAAKPWWYSMLRVPKFKPYQRGYWPEVQDGEVTVQGPLAKNFQPYNKLLDVFYTASQAQKVAILRKILLTSRGSPMLYSKYHKRMIGLMLNQMADDEAKSLVEELMTSTLRSGDPLRIFFPMANSIAQLMFRGPIDRGSNKGAASNIYSFIKSDTDKDNGGYYGNSKPSDFTKGRIGNFLGVDYAQILRKSLESNPEMASIYGIYDAVNGQFTQNFAPSLLAQYKDTRATAKQMLIGGGDRQNVRQILQDNAVLLVESQDQATINQKIDELLKELDDEINHESQFTPIDLLVNVGQALGPIGVRFMQVMGQFIDIPDKYQSKFRDVYDSNVGQSKYTAFSTLEREAQTNPEVKKFVEEDLISIDEQIGGGSLVTVYSVTTRKRDTQENIILGETQQEVLKILNPNAIFRVRETVKLVHNVLADLVAHASSATVKTQFVMAEQLLNMIEQWVLGDIQDIAFMTLDPIYAHQHDNWYSSTGTPVRVVPAKSPNTKTIKRELLLFGDTLNKYIKKLTSNDLTQSEIAAVRLTAQNATLAIAEDFTRHLFEPAYVDSLWREKYLLHSDPHPGNVIISPDGVVYWIDRNYYVKLFEADTVFLRSLVLESNSEQKLKLVVSYFMSLPENAGKFDQQQLFDELAFALRNTSGQDSAVSITKIIQLLTKKGVTIPLRMIIMFKNINVLDNTLKSVGLEAYANVVSRIANQPHQAQKTLPTGIIDGDETVVTNSSNQVAPTLETDKISIAIRGIQAWIRDRRIPLGNSIIQLLERIRIIRNGNKTTGTTSSIQQKKTYELSVPALSLHQVGEPSKLWTWIQSHLHGGSGAKKNNAQVEQQISWGDSYRQLLEAIDSKQLTGDQLLDMFEHYVDAMRSAKIQTGIDRNTVSVPAFDDARETAYSRILDTVVRQADFDLNIIDGVPQDARWKRYAALHREIWEIERKIQDRQIEGIRYEPPKPGSWVIDQKKRTLSVIQPGTFMAHGGYSWKLFLMIQSGFMMTPNARINKNFLRTNETPRFSHEAGDNGALFFYPLKNTNPNITPGVYGQSQSAREGEQASDISIFVPSEVLLFHTKYMGVRRVGPGNEEYYFTTSRGFAKSSTLEINVKDDISAIPIAELYYVIPKDIADKVKDAFVAQGLDDTWFRAHVLVLDTYNSHQPGERIFTHGDAIRNNLPWIEDWLRLNHQTVPMEIQLEMLKETDAFYRPVITPKSSGQTGESRTEVVHSQPSVPQATNQPGAATENRLGANQGFEGGVVQDAQAFEQAWTWKDREHREQVVILPEHLAVLQDPVMGPKDPSNVKHFKTPEVKLVSREEMNAIAKDENVVRLGNRVLVVDKYWESLSDEIKLDLLMHEGMEDWMERNRPNISPRDIAIQLEGLKINEAERRARHQGSKGKGDTAGSQAEAGVVVHRYGKHGSNPEGLISVFSLESANEHPSRPGNNNKWLAGQDRFDFKLSGRIYRLGEDPEMDLIVSNLYREIYDLNFLDLYPEYKQPFPTDVFLNARQSHLGQDREAYEKDTEFLKILKQRGYSAFEYPAWHPKGGEILVFVSDALESVDNNSAQPLVVQGKKPVTPEIIDNKGGIDFRFLPIVIQSIDSLRASIRSMPASSLQRIDLTQEWMDIERLVNSGITPSAERLKEYLAASCFKGDLDRDMEKIISCISDILRMQEETCCATDITLKDILVVLGSGRSGEELKLAFAK